MIAIISPAKTLDFESDLQLGSATEPAFTKEAEQVMKTLSKKSPEKLKKLQGISTRLAELNYQRNQLWEAHPAKGTRQAVLAFKGDVYQGLEADNWSESDMDFAQHHLLILSGLYGVLKPGDAILPYRLEMGTDLTVGRRKNLYEFWKAHLREYFKAKVDKEQTIINLASKEYFKAIKLAEVGNPVVNVEFKDKSKGKYRVISFYAKRARGLMANYIVQNRLTHADQLKDFNLGHYYFDPDSSTDDQFVFLRDQQ